MRYIWLSGIKRLEILKPQVDDSGYDLVLEAKTIVRHIQLKGTSRMSKVNRFSVNTGLLAKPSGCVVVLLFDPSTLDLGPFLWMGGLPGQPLPNLGKYPISKHTKANAQGVKLDRPGIRSVPRKAFDKVPTIIALAERLFGRLPVKQTDSNG